MFYDYRNPGKGIVSRPNLCGAAIDTDTGALIVDLPSMSEYDANGFMGRGVMHMNDIWLFAANIASNALERVAASALDNSPDNP